VVVVKKRYSYRAYPTLEQQRSLARLFGSCRVVFNDAAPAPARVWQPATALADIWSGGTYGLLDRDAFDDTLSDPLKRAQRPQ
jgi:hypothetical protein